MVDDRKKKILIVIDVQNDFITDALRNEEAIKTLPNIVNLVKNESFYETYVTMDTHRTDRYDDTLEGRKLPIRHCIEGTNGWNMPDELKIALMENQTVVNTFEKNTFGSRWMCDFIRCRFIDNQVDVEDCEFTIVGFCTDICVISNAIMLRNEFPNTEIKVIGDCTAGVTRETKEAALATMRMCQIDVV